MCEADFAIGGFLTSLTGVGTLVVAYEPLEPIGVLGAVLFLTKGMAGLMFVLISGSNLCLLH